MQPFSGNYTYRRRSIDYNRSIYIQQLRRFSSVYPIVQTYWTYRTLPPVTYFHGIRLAARAFVFSPGPRLLSPTALILLNPLENQENATSLEPVSDNEEQHKETLVLKELNDSESYSKCMAVVGKTESIDGDTFPKDNEKQILIRSSQGEVIKGIIFNYQARNVPDDVSLEVSAIDDPLHYRNSRKIGPPPGFVKIVELEETNSEIMAEEGVVSDDIEHLSTPNSSALKKEYSIKHSKEKLVEETPPTPPPSPETVQPEPDVFQYYDQTLPEIVYENYMQAEFNQNTIKNFMDQKESILDCLPNSIFWHDYISKNARIFLRSHQEQNPQYFPNPSVEHLVALEAEKQLLLNQGKNWTKSPQDKYLFCTFCRNNGRPIKEWRSHPLRSFEDKLTCPVLRSIKCVFCGHTGDRAHTMGYCDVYRGMPESRNKF